MLVVLFLHTGLLGCFRYMFPRSLRMGVMAARHEPAAADCKKNHCSPSSYGGD